MVSKFLADHSHSGHLVALFFMRSVPEEKEVSTFAYIRQKVASWFTFEMNSVEAMETEILKHEGTVLMEIDVSNPLLHSI